MPNKSSTQLKRILPDQKSKAPAVLITEIIIGAALCLLSFFFFIVITDEVLEKEGTSLDLVVSQAVYEFRSPVLNDLMYTISFFGGEFTLFAAVCIASYLLLKNYKREAIFLFLTISGGYAINLALKYLLKIPRPSIDPLYIERFYSFPSGHAMNSFIFYAALAYLTYHFTKQRILSVTTAIAASILIFLIGFSRIYLGVHYPSDVIAGFIAGFWWVITTILIDKTLVFYRSRSK
jgi:membrane-associated phospholipid phosphatase